MTDNYLDIEDDEFDKLAENYKKRTKPKITDEEIEKKKKEEEAFIKYVLENEKVEEEALNFTQKVHIMKEALKNDILNMKDENNNKQKILNEDNFLKIVKK